MCYNSMIYSTCVFKHNYWNVSCRQAAYISQLEKQIEEQNSSDLLRKLRDCQQDVEHLRARLESQTAPKYEVEKLRRYLG